MVCRNGFKVSCLFRGFRKCFVVAFCLKPMSFQPFGFVRLTKLAEPKMEWGRSFFAGATVCLLFAYNPKEREPICSVVSLKTLLKLCLSGHEQQGHYVRILVLFEAQLCRWL